MKIIGKILLLGVVMVSLLFSGLKPEAAVEPFVEEESLIAFKVMQRQPESDMTVEVVVDEDIEVPPAPDATEDSNDKPASKRVVADRSGRDSNTLPVPAATPVTEKQAIAPSPKPVPTPPQEKAVTHLIHTVVAGDTFWLIAQHYGIPMAELLKVNQMTASTPIQTGMKLTVPQYHIPQKTTPGPQFGELMDWWTEAQYFWPIGTDARIIDFKTGKGFMARRTVGAFHADVEPLTAEDSRIMQEIWGGWSWNARSVIVEVKGRRLAASANGMPHNIQTITNNNFNGHFCIHFLNSTRHSDNQIQADHQQNVRIAAGQ